MPRAREDWTGIHPHNGGWRAIVSRAGAPKLRKWYPRSTPVAVMQKWRSTEQAKWLLVEKPKLAKGTFRGDVELYLKHPNILRLPTYKERAPQLAKWVAEFGSVPRRDITEDQVRQIRDRWATEARSDMDARPLSPGRVNRLMATLSNLWTTLDGAAAFNPCRHIAPLVEEQGPVRDIPRDDVMRILAALSTYARPVKGGHHQQGSKTRARVIVMATTGLPAATLKKLTPQDVDLKKRIIYRPERQKGRGAERSPQPMTKAAVEAFQEFGRLNCWGPFSNSSILKSFKIAAKKAGITRPIRVYDLRHTFLTELARASQDEVAVMHIAQHASIATTRRYTRGSMSERAQAAVAAYEAATTATRSPRKTPPKKSRRVH